MSEQDESYVERLVRQVNLRLVDSDFENAARFAELFWSRTPEEDLQQRNAEDDAGATIDSWRRFQQRSTNEVQIFVENPEHARDGWQSTHTVVRVMAPDMPFVVDSVLMALSHDGLTTHHLSNVVFAVDRNASGGIDRIGLERDHGTRELMIYAETDRLEATEMEALQQRLEQTARDLLAIVRDFVPMRERLESIVEALRAARPPLPDEEVDEGIRFLEWLGNDNFVFLGYREFEYAEDTIRQVGTPLGSLRERPPASARRLSEQPEYTRAFLTEPRLLSFSKSGTKSNVHRPAYPDYVGVKRINDDGRVVGEYGFLGLYTSNVYMEHPRNIPVIRRKFENVIARSDLDPNGFDGKTLAQVLATYPRDELFEIDEQGLYENALAITYIHERRRIRLFARFERYGLFVNCLVYMPRDLFNTQSRTRVQNLLIETFAAADSEFDIHVSESTLVRLQFVLRVSPGNRPRVDVRALEKRIADLVGDWISDLNAALISAFGEAYGRRHAHEYCNAFPPGYRDHFNVRNAVDDVASIESLSAEQPLITRFYRAPEDPEQQLRLKVFHLGEPLPLSDVIPQLENMGLRVVGEHPHLVSRSSGPVVSIGDFLLFYDHRLDLADVGERFQDAFVRTWNGATENDAYNRLILGAGLTWREVSVLRTYGRYMKQIRFGFSQEFISNTLANHLDIAADLVRYFLKRFAPDESYDAELGEQILLALDAVALLNEDRILRKFVELINATKRTNYFTVDDGDGPRSYISIKLAPAEIDGMPLPRPMFEIFVCAPQFEGVHLRGGPIARGGLRWSDRLEDYRTEVLGLVKAQMVKNAVIVPTGAKGGFVIKPAGGSAPASPGVVCYRQFVAGLLEVTDNIVHGEVRPPEQVRRYDGDDPYLVVAADKGTATFSDEANEVAESKGFWLGDAFASGGSNGYDHKAMGITARGAWVSVQRHFAEQGIDVQRQPITVLGIGDMSGDVFGNGMLLSPCIKLVAAFNHQHIFVDPDPNPDASFAERQRLFALPVSRWADYQQSLISEGGGVFSRQAKHVEITPQMRAAFAIDATRLTPDELVHALLKSPVQLIWNGGIGTYVKATDETDADVGDRANDGVRVLASELRCQAFGEGGNLGLTQLARVEFARAGGAVNTDFIDNAAGVDCSDHEVNIKIALNEMVAEQDMTGKQRNRLLQSMTDEVATLVLANNRRQTQALSLALRYAQSHRSEYQRFIARMEADLDLDRRLEHLPAEDVLRERLDRGEGLTRPEMAVLLAFSKTHIKRHLEQSAVHLDPLIARMVLLEFPTTLVQAHEQRLFDHRLSREIVATQLANDIVDHMGITFVVHLLEFAGGTVSDVVRAYCVAAESLGIRERFKAVEALHDVPEEIKLSMLLEQVRGGRRATRWLLRNRPNLTNLQQLIDHFRPRLAVFGEPSDALADDPTTRRRLQRVQELTANGVPEDLARSSADTPDIAVALPIIDAADSVGADPTAVATAFAGLGQALGLDWLTEQLLGDTSGSHWEAMERSAMLDDITTHQCSLAARAATTNGGDVAAWLAENGKFVHRWENAMEQARHATAADSYLFASTCRKLDDLCKGMTPH